MRGTSGDQGGMFSYVTLEARIPDWMKTVGLLHKMRHRGVENVGWVFTFTAAVYDLVRMRTLRAEARA